MTNALCFMAALVLALCGVLGGRRIGFRQSTFWAVQGIVVSAFLIGRFL